LSLVAARRHALIRAVFTTTRASTGARSADQTRVRGGCSGGGRPTPSGQKSFCSGASLPETAKGGRNVAVAGPARNWLIQAAVNTHLSQSTGAGAFVGQHGMSPAISSDMAAIELSAIADIDVSAITGRASGASSSPAITEIASSRRMVI